MDMANTVPTTNEHVTADDLNKEIVNVSDSDNEDEIADTLEKMSNNRLYQELDDIRYKNETMMVNLNHRSILVPALHTRCHENLVELTRKEKITAQIKTQLKYNKNLRNYFVSGTIIKQDIDRMFFFKAKNAKGRRKYMIIKKNTNREHKTWSNGSYIKQQPLQQQQQQQQPQNPEVEMIDEPIEIINVEDQVRDDDSVKSIDTTDTDLNRDFACFEMDETTHASLENCSMLPIECRSITNETEEYGNGHYQDVLATAIKEAERMFSDQTIECYQDDIDNKKMVDPSAITPMDVPDMTVIKEADSMLSDQTIECYQDNIDNKRMIDPSNITPMNVPDMTPVEDLTQGKTHTEFFINQTKPLNEGEGCILLEKELIRPQIIKFRKH